MFTLCYAVFVTINYIQDGSSNYTYDNMNRMRRQNNSQRTVCYCYYNKLFPRNFALIYIISLIPILLLICAAAILTYFLNKKLYAKFWSGNRSRDLQQRFAIWSNIGTSQWMIPITVFSTITSTLGLTLSTTGRLIFVDSGNNTNYFTFINVFQLVFCIEYTVCPILMIRCVN